MLKKSYVLLTSYFHLFVFNYNLNVYEFLDVKEEIIKLLRMYKRDFPEKCLSLTLPEDLSKLFNET